MMHIDLLNGLSCDPNIKPGVARCFVGEVRYLTERLFLPQAAEKDPYPSLGSIDR
jgi:hypothetical protein